MHTQLVALVTRALRTTVRLVTAATTVATTTSTATTSTATVAAASTLARFGFVHGQWPAFMFGFIQSADGCLRLSFGGHFDEAKTFTAARVAICNDIRTRDRTELRKQLFQLGTRNVVAQVSAI